MAQKQQEDDKKFVTDISSFRKRIIDDECELDDHMMSHTSTSAMPSSLRGPGRTI